jgi:hypothetical protein
VPGSARTQLSYRAVLSSVTCGPKRRSKNLSFHYDVLDHYMDRGGVIYVKNIRINFVYLNQGRRGDGRAEAEDKVRVNISAATLYSCTIKKCIADTYHLQQCCLDDSRNMALPKPQIYILPLSSVDASHQSRRYRSIQV